MREIKFRAWFNNQMFNVRGIEFSSNVFPDGSINLSAGGFVSLKDTPLMQYTGLKDKSGKEICEGDIVKCYYACSLPFIAVVEFRDGCFDIKSQHCREYLKVLVVNYGIEVIGNVYENPELLKEK